MAINYIYPPTGESSQKEAWRWVAVYKDGTKLEQFDFNNGKPVFHRFAEIDIEQVSEFRLEHDKFPPVKFYPPQGSKLIHAYTIRKAQHLTSDNQYAYSEDHKGYKFGYQQNGQTTAVFVDSDNSIILTNDLDSIVVARDK